jgi:hypothetical protein
MCLTASASTDEISIRDNYALKEFWRELHSFVVQKHDTSAYQRTLEDTATIHVLGNVGLSTCSGGMQLLQMLSALSQTRITAPLDISQHDRSAITHYVDPLKYSNWIRCRNKQLKLAHVQEARVRAHHDWLVIVNLKVLLVRSNSSKSRLLCFLHLSTIFPFKTIPTN